MKKVLKEILQSIYFYAVRFPVQVLRLISNKKLMSPKETYYPEQKGKGAVSIFFDQVRHLMKWRSVEIYYFLYGFDVKSYKEQKSYLDYPYFMRRRDFLNNHPNPKETYSYTGILRDKYFFSIFMEKMGFRVPKTLGLIDNGNLISGNTHLSISSIAKYQGRYICKPLDGIGGVGIGTLDIQDGEISYNGKFIQAEELTALLGKGRYFVQERIENQHQLMSSLYPKAINTLRVTTVRDVKTGNIQVMGCMLLMGARNSIVSNWHYGGVIINVNDDGTLDKYGYSLYEKRITLHPETGVVFESFTVPYFEEAINEAKRCHSMFYGIHSVGWDFAILSDGVMFIEGNDNWGMAAHQMVSGGWVEKFNKYFV